VLCLCTTSVLCYYLACFACAEGRYLLLPCVLCLCTTAYVQVQIDLLLPRDSTFVHCRHEVGAEQRVRGGGGGVEGGGGGGAEGSACKDNWFRAFWMIPPWRAKVTSSCGACLGPLCHVTTKTLNPKP
jgi:hypothetical protein